MRPARLLFLCLGLSAAVAGAATAQSPQTSPMPPAMSTGRGAPTAPVKPAAPSTPPAGTTARTDLIDLNSASKEALAAELPGIGPVRAEAIVRNRPYRGKDEIVGKAGVPRSVYEKIKDMVVARQGR